MKRRQSPHLAFADHTPHLGSRDEAPYLESRDVAPGLVPCDDAPGLVSRDRAPGFVRAFVLALSLLALAACTSGPSGGGPALGQPQDVTTTLGEPVTVPLVIVSDSAASLTVTATSSNEQVLPDAGIQVTGTGVNRSLALAPSHTQTGTSTVTVTVKDDRGFATRDFDLEVEVLFTQSQTLTTTGAEPIGISLAIQGETLVAGGLESAFVFELSADEWVEKQKLTSLVNGIFDVKGFGGAVALDGSRILVGADESTNTDVSQGAAYVFDVGSGASYEYDGSLLDNDPADNERFGRSVGVLGDDLFVGVPGGSVADVQSGAVNVYQPDGMGGWSLLGKLTPSDATTGTVFGETLDVSTGLTVVGDYANDERGTDAGAAYVFEADGGFWSEATKLAPAELDEGDHFGIAVTGDGDWVLVGAWNDDTQAEDAGAVYVFHREASVWEQVDVLYSPDPEQFAGFGSSLALEYPYAVVSAKLEDEGENNAGAVYVFRHDGTTWHEVAKLASPEPAANAQFGWGVGISGDHVVASQASPALTVVFRRQ